jgi:hypothetical protein
MQFDKINWAHQNVYKQAPVPDYFLADFHVVIEWDKLQSV